MNADRQLALSIATMSLRNLFFRSISKFGCMQRFCEVVGLCRAYNSNELGFNKKS